jgi:hypothetical protein
VIDVATKLLNAVNVALRLSDGCDGFELCGVVERRNGAIHRTMLCRTGVYRISGGELRVDGKPARSKEERLVSLMERDGSVDDIAHALSALPMTWPALKKTYETVVGIMSSKSKPEDARRDFENLIAKDWLTLDESNRFYYTAAFIRTATQDRQCGYMICAPRREGERQRICRSNVVRPAVAWFLNSRQIVARWALPATRRLHPMKPWSPCRSGDRKSAGRSRPYR